MRMRILCGTFLAPVMAIALGESALAGLPPQASATVTNAAAATEARTYVGRSGDSLNYRIYAPEKVEARRRYPLVLFLHGAGERGNDNAMQLTWGVWPIISYMKSKGMKLAGTVPLWLGGILRGNLRGQSLFG